MRTNHRIVALAVLLACGKSASPGGTGGSGDTGGSGGDTGGATTGGAPGTGGGPGTGGAPARDATPGDTAVAADTATTSEDLRAPGEAGPARVLVYTLTSGTVHVAGIAAAASSFKAALGAMGITVDT